MIPLRSFIDPNQHYATGPTCFMTERNEHEVRCGMCSRPMYVDQATYDSAANTMKDGFENPFLCEICENEYDDLTY